MLGLSSIKKSNSVIGAKRQFNEYDRLYTKLRATLWDDTVHIWEIDGRILIDQDRPQDGEYVKIGSYGTNYWFHVTASATVKQTLGNARRSLTQKFYLVDQRDHPESPYSDVEKWEYIED